MKRPPMWQRVHSGLIHHLPFLATMENLQLLEGKCLICDVTHCIHVSIGTYMYMCHATHIQCITLVPDLKLCRMKYVVVSRRANYQQTMINTHITPFYL